MLISIVDADTTSSKPESENVLKDLLETLALNLEVANIR